MLKLVTMLLGVFLIKMWLVFTMEYYLIWFIFGLGLYLISCPHVLDRVFFMFVCQTKNLVIVLLKKGLKSSGLVTRKNVLKRRNTFSVW